MLKYTTSTASISEANELLLHYLVVHTEENSGVLKEDWTKERGEV
jgi:hypothetical protein